jgi:hypothetical protein
VRSDTGLIARANSEEDDNPLPQAEPVAITPTDLLEVGVRQISESSTAPPDASPTPTRPSARR